jgi:hypothetical protein
LDIDNLTIVCYTGGTCGDLISAIIDPTDCAISANFGTIIHNPERTRLKKPHLFDSDSKKQLYIDSVTGKYKSISSHDATYHIAQKHDFLSIIVKDFDYAIWAAERFKKCHRAHVWEEMQKQCGANNIKEYTQKLIEYSSMIETHTQHIIKLENILNGDILTDLINLNYNLSDDGVKIYSDWLSKQKFSKKFVA